MRACVNCDTNPSSRRSDLCDECEDEGIPETNKRKEMIAYFEELCGPHLNSDIYLRTTDDIEESYNLSKKA